MSIQVVEEGIRRALLPRVRIREHPFYTHRIELLAESGHDYLLRSVESVGQAVQVFDSLTGS